MLLMLPTIQPYHNFAEAFVYLVLYSTWELSLPGGSCNSNKNYAAADAGAAANNTTSKYSFGFSGIGSYTAKCNGSSSLSLCSGRYKCNNTTMR